MEEEKTYYLVPIKKELVMFPGVVTSVVITKKKSLNILGTAFQNKEHIFMVLNKNPSNDEDEIDNFYSVGVICKILQKSSDDTLENQRIIIEGIEKAKLKKVINDSEKTLAVVEKIKINNPTKKETEEILNYRKVLINKLKDFLNITGQFREELYIAFDLFKSIDELIFYACQFISLTSEKKQELLEINKDLDKIKKFMEFIDIEYSLIKIDKKINSAVEKKFMKYQKKAYLNEKVKQIKKELGDEYEEKDDVGEVAELKRRCNKTKLSEEAKKKCKEELKKMDGMLSYSSEYQITKNYIELVLSLPWGKKTELKNSMADAEKILNKYHYGLPKIKERILEFLAVYKRKKSLSGQIICLVGAPGVGKTSLAKSIAEALNREYVKISLGGIRDEAEIRGHRKTYVGAMPGRIINAIKKAHTNNPLILLDEIDKMSIDYHGDPASALLEVLDPEQNKKFEDHFLEVEYDLSDVMFITTANNISNIPIPLRDRMEIIRLSGYTEDEKLNIAKQYLIPKQLEKNGLKEKEFTITDNAIIGIIRNYTFEAGVRNLEREIDKIIRKCVKNILINKKIKKIKITEKNLKDFLSIEKFNYNKVDKNDRVGVAVGLAYTDFGGDLLNIESLKFSGTGKLITTGKLGEVMKESAQIAFSYVRSIADKFKINSKEFNKYDFHLHVPDGATPKDGPSAGVAITASLLSSMIGKEIHKDVAMTGEISLTGRVMPIGGLKEKLLAALRGNIKQVVIPKDNKKDLEEIPDIVKEKLNIVPVDNINDALKIIIKGYK